MFELPRFSAETSWPTDADQRLIRIGYGKFIHPPRLVFWRLLKFAGRGVNIFEVEIQPEGVSARYQPSLHCICQM